jgi:hypothetical protein
MGAAAAVVQYGMGGKALDDGFGCGGGASHAYPATGKDNVPLAQEGHLGMSPTVSIHNHRR